MIILTDAPERRGNSLNVPTWMSKEALGVLRQNIENQAAFFRQTAHVLDANGQPYYGDDDWTAYRKRVTAREKHDRP